MDFSQALLILKDGRKITRSFWSAAYLYIDTNSAIILYENCGGNCKYTIAQQDILSDDWEIKE